MSHIRAKDLQKRQNVKRKRSNSENDSTVLPEESVTSEQALGENLPCYPMGINSSSPIFNVLMESPESYEVVEDLDLFHSKYLDILCLLEIGKRLRLQLEITATAIVIFHRFSLEKKKVPGDYSNYNSLKEYFKEENYYKKETIIEENDRKTIEDENNRLYSLETKDFSSEKAFIIMSCIFLACKIGDSQRRMRDVINVCLFTIESRLRQQKEKYYEQFVDKRLIKDNDDILQNNFGSQQEIKTRFKFPIFHVDLEKVKNSLIHCEQWVLRILAFDIEIFSPFRYMLNYAHSIRAPDFIVQLSWSLILESLASVDCLLYPPNTIAVSSLYLSIDIMKSKFKHALQTKLGTAPSPPRDENGKGVNVEEIIKKQKELESMFQGEWWILFDVHITQIQEWCARFQIVYEKIKALNGHLQT